MWELMLELKGKWHLYRLVLKMRRAYLFAVAGLVLGIVSLVLSLAPPYQFTLALLSAIGLLIGLAVLVNDVRAIRKQSGSLVEQRLTHEYVYNRLSKLEKSDKYADFEVESFGDQIAIYSRQVNRLLWNTELSFQLIKKRFEVPEKAKGMADFILKSAARSGALIFNDQKVRLVSDPVVPRLSRREGPVLQIQRTDYFSSICTNELTGMEIWSRKEGTCLHDGFELMSNNGVILDLDESLCSNHIGVSSIAITADGYLILLRQTRRTAQSPGLLAPSGSGSVDFKDYECWGDSFLVRGMEREMLEECGLIDKRSWSHEQYIYESGLIGFARVVSRGGKPDFFGFSVLRKGKDDIRVRHKERPFIADKKDVKTLLGNAPKFVSYVDKLIKNEKARMSFPLYLNLMFLQAFVKSNTARFREMVKYVLDRGVE